MRKVFYTSLFLLLFLMCGCSVPITALHEDSNVETLKSWSFQFNEGTNDYSIFFGLLNKNSKSISADVDVDIRIVNEKTRKFIRVRSLSLKAILIIIQVKLQVNNISQN